MSKLTDFLQAGQTVVSNLFLIHFKKLGLTTDEFVLWLQLYMYSEVDSSFIDFQKIAQDLEIDNQEVYQLVNQLITKNMLAIQSERNSNGQMQDTLLFQPAFEKLEIWLDQQERQHTNQVQENQRHKLHRLFETEFGRPLSSIEFQRIQQWLDEDHYTIELIELALKEAVLNQVYNFNYIDRILLAWERKNIQTKQQVNEAQKDRQRRKLQNTAVTNQAVEGKKPKVSLHNWLEPDNHD